MATMRAVLIKDGKGPIENLFVGETEKPVPKPGEVLVKVRLSMPVSLDCASLALTCILHRSRPLA